MVARDTVVLGGLSFFAGLTALGFQSAMARMLPKADYADLFAVLALFAVLSVPTQLLLPIGTRMTSLARRCAGALRRHRGFCGARSSAPESPVWRLGPSSSR